MCIHHAFTCIRSKCYTLNIYSIKSLRCVLWFWHSQKTLSSPVEGANLGLDPHSPGTFQQTGLCRPQGWHQSSSGCLAVSSGSPKTHGGYKGTGHMMKRDHDMHMIILHRVHLQVWLCIATCIAIKLYVTPSTIYACTQSLANLLNHAACMQCMHDIVWLYNWPGGVALLPYI